MEQGHSVGTIDLDARQGTLSRMFENREAFAAANGLELPMPLHVSVPRSQADSRVTCQREEHEALRGALEAMTEADFIVIDTPGSDLYLSHLAHGLADTLITPVNDSFVDLDVLGHVDATDGSYKEPSCYSRMVLAERERRAAEGREGFDWFVMRNRLSNLYARNKKDMVEAMDELARHLDFRMAPGFGERVIFRELFTKGLTLLDLRRREIGIEWTMSHVSAREELRQLVEATSLEEAADSTPDIDAIAARTQAELPKQRATAA
jgi:chromosome partitioning protein